MDNCGGRSGKHHERLKSSFACCGQLHGGSCSGAADSDVAGKDTLLGAASSDTATFLNASLSFSTRSLSDTSLTCAHGQQPLLTQQHAALV